jgi:hypothetical protein
MEIETSVRRYPEGFREMVVAGVKREGFWETVERYGVPFGTVRYCS